MNRIILVVAACSVAACSTVSPVRSPTELTLDTSLCVLLSADNRVSIAGEHREHSDCRVNLQHEAIQNKVCVLSGYRAGSASGSACEVQRKGSGYSFVATVLADKETDGVACRFTCF